MTREEAAKILEKQFDESCGDYRYQNKDKLNYEDALWLAIAALREQREGKMDWISVRERLPEEKEPVIILLQDGQVFRGEIRERILLPEWWYYYDAGDTDMDIMGHIYSTGDGMWIHDNPVIAWMPLPEPPKGGMKA